MNIAYWIFEEYITMFRPIETCYLVRLGSGEFAADWQDGDVVTAKLPEDAAIFTRLGAINAAKRLGNGACALMFTKSGKLRVVKE